MEHSVQPDTGKTRNIEGKKFLANRRKSRIGLLLIISAFVLPALLAKLALDRQWLNYGVTNQGTIPKSEILLSDLGLNSENLPKNWLVLVPVNQCQSYCDALVKTITNSRTAIGREMHRVTPVALFGEQPATTPTIWHQEPLPENFADHIDSKQIFIADPLGRIIMHYPIKEEKLARLGQAIVADMKKLLKYSQIG